MAKFGPSGFNRQDFSGASCESTDRLGSLNGYIRVEAKICELCGRTFCRKGKEIECPGCVAFLNTPKEPIPNAEGAQRRSEAIRAGRLVYLNDPTREHPKPEGYDEPRRVKQRAAWRRAMAKRAARAMGEPKPPRG